MYQNMLNSGKGYRFWQPQIKLNDNHLFGPHMHTCDNSQFPGNFPVFRRHKLASQGNSQILSQF